MDQERPTYEELQEQLCMLQEQIQKVKQELSDMCTPNWLEHTVHKMK